MSHSTRSKADSARSSHHINRRHFFENVTGATAAVMIGAAVVPVAPTQASGEAILTEGGLVKPGDRTERAYEMRLHAALVQKRLPYAKQRSNGDEGL